MGEKYGEDFNIDKKTEDIERLFIMSKTKEVTETKQALTSFLKQNEEHHYNFEDEIDYKVSCGSLKVDFELNGGLGPAFIGSLA